MNKKEKDLILKLMENSVKRNSKYMKQEVEDLERSTLEFEISFHQLQQANGTSFDEDERKEQRRRLWKLSIIKNKEDDEFLKRMGLIHISKIGTWKKMKDKIKISEEDKARAQEALELIKKGKRGEGWDRGDYNERR